MQKINQIQDLFILYHLGRRERPNSIVICVPKNYLFHLLEEPLCSAPVHVASH